MRYYRNLCNPGLALGFDVGQHTDRTMSVSVKRTTYNYDVGSRMWDSLE
jgi:hypothetical protein